MSDPAQLPQNFRAILTFAIIEAVLMFVGVGLFLATGIYWGLVAAALIGFVLFVALVLLPSIRAKGGDVQP